MQILTGMFLSSSALVCCENLPRLVLHCTPLPCVWIWLVLEHLGQFIFYLDFELMGLKLILLAGFFQSPP